VTNVAYRLILSCRMCDVIVLNVHVSTEDKSDDTVTAFMKK
jgi:hypothetical protein